MQKGSQGGRERKESLRAVRRSLVRKLYTPQIRKPPWPSDALLFWASITILSTWPHAFNINSGGETVSESRLGPPYLTLSSARYGTSTCLGLASLCSSRTVCRGGFTGHCHCCLIFCAQPRSGMAVRQAWLMRGIRSAEMDEGSEWSMKG